ncbi:MAG: 1-acyl-sn-glycerol-3-phosphate acyltransferase [Myxococcota bacterium]
MGDQALGAAGQTRAATPTSLLSAMTPRFNLLLRAFARRYFRDIGLDDATVDRLRGLESRGAVIYVMRYASRLDYFLFNALFRRHGLRLSRFANGIRFHYYRPLWESLRIAWARPRGASQEVEFAQSRAQTRKLTLDGESFFLFLRTARLRTWPRGRRKALERGKNERDLLLEVVRAAWDSDATVHVVPLALFWRKGPRARRRFLNLFYGAATRPTDVAKVTSFLTTYRGLSVKVGEPVDLGAFVESRRGDGEQTVARKLRRSILMFLYREEKVVEGPTLQPLHKVQEAVLAAPRVQAAIEARAMEKRRTHEGARLEAEGIVREIAANMNSTVLAVLNAVVTTVIRRLFTSVHPIGLERVAEFAKRHPIVLVPSHRSYFDFLILSTMFYSNYLVPPHVATRDNMGFGPFGYLWRRVGAFYMRRSFDDPLYKEVFRAYLSYLIREGFTQEFFIEGGRSRTGKTVPPRLGMLTWNVEAFLDSRRRDLFFVPISISYERLVEERAMVGELEGEKKSKESMVGLMRARKYLRRRFGSVYVNFGEPISLADALGERKERMDREKNEVEKRTFIEGLGNRIAERINWAAVPNTMSVAACALLGERRRGMFRADLASRMQEIVDLLRIQGVKLTDALDPEDGNLDESIASLLPSDLIHLNRDARGDILYFEESGRRPLDLYRNSIVQFLAAPSFLARRLLVGPCRDDIRRDVAGWLDLFYWEFFTPRAEILATHIDSFLDHFEHFGRIERVDGELRATEKGLPYFRFLAELTRGVVEVYYATFAAVQVAPGALTAKSLLKAAEEQYERAGLLGEVDRSEAANPVAFTNAIDWLVRSHVLERVIPDKDRGSSRDPAYERGDAFEDLVGLRQRLATALAAR